MIDGHGWSPLTSALAEPSNTPSAQVTADFPTVMGEPNLAKTIACLTHVTQNGLTRVIHTRWPEPQRKSLMLPGRQPLE